MPIPTWLSNFIGFGWIRDLLGIRKDVVDLEKSKLEVKRLKDEERTRHSLITPATFDDVMKYDPKIKWIEKLVGKGSRQDIAPRREDSSQFRPVLELILFILALFGLSRVIRWLIKR